MLKKILKNMHRIKKTVLNITISMAMSIVTILTGLITQKVFVNYLGLEYLGINGLFTNIISMLGIIELGLGSAIVYHLYKPAADSDEVRIKSIINFYKLGYRIIAMIVTIVGLIIMPILPSLVGDINIDININIVYILFLMDIIFSYILTYKRSILYADQKNYLVNISHLTSTFIMNITQIVALAATSNFYLYLIIKITMRILENVAINIIVNQRYTFLRNGDISPIDNNTKQDIFIKIKALFIHKIGSFIILGSDNIIISMFFGIAVVGLYSNYYLVIAAIIMLVGQVFTSITASIGNLLTTSSSSKSYEIYNLLRFINFWLSSLASIGMIVSMDSFINNWLGDKYILSIDVLLALSLNLYLQLMRSNTNSFKEAAGIFHEDRFVPIIESVVNIVFSIILLQFFGLAGVFIGTICSNLVLHLFSYPRYVYTQLFKRSYRDYYIEFTKYLIITLVAGAVTFLVSRTVVINNMFVHFVINVAISLSIPSTIFYITYRNSDEFIYFKNLIVKIFTKVKIRKYMK